MCLVVKEWKREGAVEEQCNCHSVGREGKRGFGAVGEKEREVDELCRSGKIGREEKRDGGAVGE